MLLLQAVSRPSLPLGAEDALAQKAASARISGDEDGPSSSASNSNVPSPFPTSPSLQRHQLHFNPFNEEGVNIIALGHLARQADS